MFSQLGFCILAVERRVKPGRCLAVVWPASGWFLAVPGWFLAGSWLFPARILGRDLPASWRSSGRKVIGLKLLPRFFPNWVPAF
jgi:hypothetical protein